MKLLSKQGTIRKSQEEVYDYLIQLENYEKLMPDNTEKFEVDGSSFLFALKGMPEIRLVLKEEQPFNTLVLGAASSKLDFTLETNLESIDANTSRIQLEFNGDFNPMMAMMVKGPLQKFIDTLVEKAESL
jgi:carbon monoxide dehydrogenase subunit G